MEKTITTSDLLSLKNEIKYEISEDQRKIRHELASKLQGDYNSIDEKVARYNTEVLLTNQAFLNMTNQFKELKDMMIEEFKKVNTKIDWFWDKYVTHSELKPIQDKQKDHDDIITRVVWWIVIAFVSLTAWIIWLSKYI